MLLLVWLLLGVVSVINAFLFFSKPSASNRVFTLFISQVRCLVVSHLPAVGFEPGPVDCLATFHWATDSETRVRSDDVTMS